MKRRTNPGYLSSDEAARDRDRTADVVRGITRGVRFDRCISGSNGFKKTECIDRLCDSCGTTVQSDHWYCEKCGKKIGLFQEKEFPQCPMCDRGFEYRYPLEVK